MLVIPSVDIFVFDIGNERNTKKDEWRIESKKLCNFGKMKDKIVEILKSL